VKTLTCINIAVACLMLTSSAAVWASAPTTIATTTATDTTVSWLGPIAVTTTVPGPSFRPAYVVAAAADANQDLEVIAWQDTTLAQVPAIGVEQGGGLLGVGITGLDSGRVVTASIDGSGALSIITWSVSSAGVVEQKGYSTSENNPYHNVAITTLSSTEVVTVFRQATGSFAVEAFTIDAEGLPTPVLPIVNPPASIAGTEALQVSIATVGGNLVTTATNDSDLDLVVMNWRVDSAGVHAESEFFQGGSVSNNLGGNVAIAAGTKIRLNDKPPFLQYVQSAVTPTIDGSANVHDFYWSISDTGGLTRTGEPAATTSDNEFYVAACMLPDNTAITVYANDSGIVSAGQYGIGALGTYPAITNERKQQFKGLAATAAGSDFSLFHAYNAYFVTADLTYTTPSSGEPIGTLGIQEWKYPVGPLMP
jgi:hypothetical protein